MPKSGIDKTNINWIDLDDSTYTSHFGKDQCYLKVNFAHSGGGEDKVQLPVYPEEIAFNGSTNYHEGEILGRPGKIAGYISTSDTQTRINLKLHRELATPGVVATDMNYIDKIISLMQAAHYPKKFQNGLYAPIVTYVFGDTKITGRQTSFNHKWGGPKISGIYMLCTIDIGVTHMAEGINYYDDVFGKNPRDFSW